MADTVLLDAAPFAALERAEGRCELVLVDGEIVPVTPTGFEHARIVLRIGRILADFADRSGCGTVIAGDPGFVWDEHNVRAPDVAVVSRSDAANAPARGFMPFAPLLAVEVVAPTDFWHAVHVQASGWLKHGAKAVWVVDPIDKLVVVHHPDQSLRELRGTELLSGDQALPGFSCSVADLFNGQGT